MTQDKAAVSFPLRLNRPIKITRFSQNKQTASVKLTDCRIGSSGTEDERVTYFVGSPQVERMIAAFNMMSIPLSGWRESEWGQSSLTRMEDHGLLRDWLYRFDSKVELAGFEDDGFSDYATPRLAGAIVRHLVSATDTQSEPTDAIGCIVLPDCVIAAVGQGFRWLSHMADPASAPNDIKPGVFEQRRLMSSRELGPNLPALRRVEGGKFILPRSLAILADVFLNLSAVEGGRVTARQVADMNARDLFDHLSQTKYFAVAEYVGEVGSGHEGDAGIWDSEGEPVWCLTILQFEISERGDGPARFDIEAVGKDRIMQPVSGEEIASAVTAMFSSMKIENHGGIASDEILFVDGEGYPIDPSTEAFCETHGFSQSPGIFGVVYDRVELICERRGALLAVAFNSTSETPFDLSGIEVSNSENGGIESVSGVKVEGPDDEPIDALAPAPDNAPVTPAGNTISPTKEAEDNAPDDEIVKAIDEHVTELSRLLYKHISAVAAKISSLDSVLRQDERTILGIANKRFKDAGGKQLTDAGQALVRAILKVEAETTVDDINAASLEDAWSANDGVGIVAVHYLRAVHQQEVVGGGGNPAGADDEQPDGPNEADRAGSSMVTQDPPPENEQHDGAEPPQSELTKNSMKFSGGQDSDPDVLLGRAQLREVAEQVTAAVGDGRVNEQTDDIDLAQAVLRETDSFGQLNAWKAKQLATLSKPLMSLGLTVAVDEQSVIRSMAYAYACATLGGDLATRDLEEQSRIVAEVQQGGVISTPLSTEQKAMAFQATVRLMHGALGRKGAKVFLKNKPDTEEKFWGAVNNFENLAAWDWESGFAKGNTFIQRAIKEDERLAKDLQATIHRWWLTFRENMLADKPDRDSVASLVVQHALRAYRDHHVRTATAGEESLADVIAAADNLNINDLLGIAGLPADWRAMDRATLANALTNRTPSRDPSAVS